MNIDPPGPLPLLLAEPGLDLSLVQREFQLQRFEAPDMYFGGVKLAAVDGDGQLCAMADPRRHGATAITG